MQSITSNTTKLRLSEIDCDECFDSLVSAILLTKIVMTGGRLPPVLVRRDSSGRYKVVGNKMSYIVSHVLNVDSVTTEILE